MNGRRLHHANLKRWVLVDDAGERLVKPTEIKNETPFQFMHVG